MEINRLLRFEVLKEHDVAIIDVLVCFRPKVTLLLVKPIMPFVEGCMDLQTISITRTEKIELTCSGGNEADHRNRYLAFHASWTFCNA